MPDRESAAAIDAAAARWVARLDGDPHDPALLAALDAWTSADPRRRGALVRAQAAWATLAAEPLAASRGLSRRRLLAAGAGIAAVAATGVGVWLALERDASFETGVGERRRARLADGSTLLLNTRSRAHAAITARARRVTLDAGEAWFHVARDRARPFVVAAGAVRVEAVGTAFAVRRLADRSEVVVTEGRVRVWSMASPARFLTLAAGRRATVAEEVGVDAAAVVEGGMDEALAWRRGELVLDGMTLGDAAAEFNRYNRRQLSVEAPLAERRIVGWFRTDDPAGFARSAAAMTGARIEQDDEGIRIVE